MAHEQDLQPLLEAQTNQLNLVFADSSTIDTKALAILGANVAIVLFIAQESLPLHVWQFTLLYAPFVLSLLLDIFSIWPREYLSVVPDLDESPEYLGMDHQTLVLQLLANTGAAIRRGNVLNRLRLRACTISISLTSLGFLALLFIL